MQQLIHTCTIFWNLLLKFLSTEYGLIKYSCINCCQDIKAPSKNFIFL